MVDVVGGAVDGGRGIVVGWTTWWVVLPVGRISEGGDVMMVDLKVRERKFPATENTSLRLIYVLEPYPAWRGRGHYRLTHPRPDTAWEWGPVVGRVLRVPAPEWGPEVGWVSP